MVAKKKQKPERWIADKWGRMIAGSDGFIVAKVVVPRLGRAELIAAAPDMLAALRVALPWLSEDEVPSLAAKAIVLAAIRKATEGE